MTPVIAPKQLLRVLRATKLVSVSVQPSPKFGRPSLIVTLDVDGKRVVRKWSGRTPWWKGLGIPDGTHPSSASRLILRQLARDVMANAQSTVEWQQYERGLARRSERRRFDQRLKRLVESGVKLGMEPDEFVEATIGYYKGNRSTKRRY